MKVFGVVMIVVIAVALVFSAGCLNVQPMTDAPVAGQPTPTVTFNTKAIAASIAASEAKAAADARAGVEAAKVYATPAKPVIEIVSFKGKWTSTTRMEVTGVIANNGPVDKAVFGYVDFFDADDVKVESSIFSCKPDAFGKATFKTAGYPDGVGISYQVRITNVYNN
jgi:hypothetical protein